MSSIKDPSLAPQGRLQLELAERRMGALLAVRERFRREQPFAGMTIGMALHVTKETGILVRTLRDGGAKVAIAGCNPLSTQDDVAAALAEEKDVRVWAYKGETKEDYYKYLTEVLNAKPDLTIDDGCDLVTEIHRNHTGLLATLVGGCEETTTGVLRLRAMERDGALKMPVIAVNDNKTKHLFDNYYGTGQSTFDGILRASNILIAGKTVVVIGYGSCGKGVALRAQGMGAQVIVTEVDPFRALQAVMDGHRVLPMNQATKVGDVFVTVTGNRHVISYEHMEQMRDSALLANAGHFDLEIDLATLEQHTTKRRVRPQLDEHAFPDGRVIFVVGEGRLANLAAAEGHPSEVMSLSFCGQALACAHLVKHRGSLKPGVITLPPEVDQEISLLQLTATGLQIDTLTSEQEKYLNGWEEGT